MRLSRALKDTQFEAESQTAEVERVTEMLKVAEARAERLQGELTKHEQTPPADETRIRKAIEDMRKSEDARGKAEQLRVKAEQERNVALHEKEDMEFELDKLRRRVGELEAGGGGSASRSGPDPATERKVSDLQNKLEEADSRINDSKRRLADAQEKLEKLQETNDELGRKLKAAQTEADAKSRGGGATGAMRAKAMEVYNNVNDVLAELRVNINVVRDEFASMAGKNADSRSRTIRDAIDAAAGQTEDVKGVLRSLRELTEE
jgi:chromosome segregation ATPase